MAASIRSRRRDRTNSTVAGPNTAPPAVALAAPAKGATVNGMVTVVANATDPAKVAGVQFQLDGANLGPAATGAGPSYSSYMEFEDGFQWTTHADGRGQSTRQEIRQQAAFR